MLIRLTIYSIIYVLLVSDYLIAAPAPFPRYIKPRPITRELLVGQWDVQWGTVPTTFDLSNNGDYICAWPGACYIGTWGYNNKQLWITESCNPALSNSWQSYSIKLTNSRLNGISGPVIIGADGISILMHRKLLNKAK